MANYKVTDNELASIANAIRTKGGTSAQLEFPEEFVSAIEDISSSSGVGSYARGILVGEYNNLSPSAGGVGGAWTSTGHNTSDDIGFIVDYYYNDNLIKTTLILKDKVLPSGAPNGQYENFGAEFAQSGYAVHATNFNVKIENDIMFVSFGAAGNNDYLAKVYTAINNGGEANILYGSEEPLSAQGDNGDIFLQTVSSMNAVLPSGYQELPAIEGTGTQYIDTSISTAQAGLSVKSKIAITGVNNITSSGGDGIWGGSWTRNGYLMTRYGISPGAFRWHNGGAVSSDVPVTLNKWISLETNGAGMIIDGVTYPAAGGANTQDTLSLFFVGSHAGGSPSKMRLGRTKVSVENTVLADFIPCKNSNNEIGMYDLIGQTFYGNAGSGSFLAVTENTITASFLKVNGAWQQLINSDIDDVDTSGGGGSATPSLPYSDQSKILASAYPGNYSDDSSTWGGLEVIKSNNGLIKNSDFIYLRDNSFAKIDLGEPNHSFVAYFVGLVLNGNQWPVAIGTLYENSLNNSISLCSNSEKICYTHSGNTIAITSLSSIKTFVGALRIDGINKLSSCFVNGEQIAQPASFNNSGQYCSFGAFSNSTYFANLFIKYLAVVDGLENDSKIISNQQHLMNLYGIE